jgi:hypothetical protein
LKSVASIKYKPVNSNIMKSLINTASDSKFGKYILFSNFSNYLTPRQNQIRTFTFQILEARKESAGQSTDIMDINKLNNT